MFYRRLGHQSCQKHRRHVAVPYALVACTRENHIDIFLPLNQSADQALLLLPFPAMSHFTQPPPPSIIFSNFHTCSSFIPTNRCPCVFALPDAMSAIVRPDKLVVNERTSCGSCSCILRKDICTISTLLTVCAELSLDMWSMVKDLIEWPKVVTKHGERSPDHEGNLAVMKACLDLVNSRSLGRLWKTVHLTPPLQSPPTWLGAGGSLTPVPLVCVVYTSC